MDKYKVSISMSENSSKQYEWEVVEYVNMFGWSRVSENGSSNSPEEALSEAKQFISTR